MNRPQVPTDSGRAKAKVAVGLLSALYGFSLFNEVSRYISDRNNLFRLEANLVMSLLDAVLFVFIWKGKAWAWVVQIVFCALSLLSILERSVALIGSPNPRDWISAAVYVASIFLLGASLKARRSSS